VISGTQNQNITRYRHAIDKPRFPSLCAFLFSAAGCAEVLHWTQNADALNIDPVQEAPDNAALVFKIMPKG